MYCSRLGQAPRLSRGDAAAGGVQKGVRRIFRRRCFAAAGGCGCAACRCSSGAGFGCAARASLRISAHRLERVVAGGLTGDIPPRRSLAAARDGRRGNPRDAAVGARPQPSQGLALPLAQSAAERIRDHRAAKRRARRGGSARSGELGCSDGGAHASSDGKDRCSLAADSARAATAPGAAASASITSRRASRIAPAFAAACSTCTDRGVPSAADADSA